MFQWLGNLFGKKEPDRPSEGSYGQKIKTSPDKFPAFLPWFDTANQALGETPEMRAAYRLMLADPNVKAAIMPKLLGVMALDVSVAPYRKKNPRDAAIAEFVRWNLVDAMAEGFPGLVWDLVIGALVDGISICEPVWELEDGGEYRGKRYLRQVKALDVGNTVVPIIDAHRNIVGIRALQYNAGEEYSPEDFIIVKHLGLFENPLGMSDFRAAYSRFWVLDTVTKLRAMGAERRAFGIVSAEYPDVSKQKSLEDALANLRYRHWMAVPEGTKLQVLDLAGQSASYFSDFRKDCQEEIFLSIAGAILQATTSGQGQNRGDSQVHKDTADLRAWHIRSLVTHALNDHKFGIVRRIVDANFFEPEGYPKVSTGGVDEKELKESLDIDKALKESFGWKFNREELEERYGRKWEDDPEKALPDMQPPGDPMAAMLGGGIPPQGDAPPPEGGADGSDLPAPIVPSEPQEAPAEDVGQFSELAGEVAKLVTAFEAFKESPREGDRNEDGLIFRSGRWHREDDSATPNVARATPGVAPAETSAPTEPDFASKDDAISALDEKPREAVGWLAKVGHGFHAVESWAKSKFDSVKAALPTAIVKPTAIGLRAAFASYTFGQSLVGQVAKANGLSDEEAEKKVAWCKAGDLIGSKIMSVAGGAVGGAAGATAASMIPMASTAYLIKSLVAAPVPTASAIAQAVTPDVEKMVADLPEGVASVWASYSERNEAEIYQQFRSIIEGVKS